MEKLSVTLIQTTLAWENADANIAVFDRLVANTDNTDIIVLPEMFTTGFTMQPSRHAEKVNGKGIKWMTEKAIEKNCVITGSICVEDHQTFYNRLYWVYPKKRQHYNKRHLFRMGLEDSHYRAGTDKIIPSVKGWKILPLVCYDLRFPVWSRKSH